MLEKCKGKEFSLEHRQASPLKLSPCVGVLMLGSKDN